MMQFEEVPNNLRELPERVSRAVQNAEIRTSRQIRDSIFRILCHRLIKFGQSAQILRDDGFSEAGLVILRSIYETHLWLRWTLQSDEKAKHYWDVGKREAARMAGILVGRFGVKVRDVEDSKTFGDIYADREIKKIALPEFVQIAREVGYERFHDAVYPYLSWMAHGNPLSFGEGLIIAAKGDSIPSGASDLNAASFDNIAGMISIPIITTVETWSQKRELSPRFKWKQ